jgi:PKD repeat protein
MTVIFVTTSNTKMKTHLRLTIVGLFVSALASAQCILPIPYTEDFSGSGWVVPASSAQTGSIAACWTRNPAANNYVWVPGPINQSFTFSGPTSDHTTGNGKFMYAVSSGFVSNTANLLTPFIDLSSATDPELTFWYHMYGQGIGSLNVEVSTGGAWTTVNTITGQQQTSQTASWLKQTVSLQSYAGDTIRLRFRANRGTSFSQFSRMAIDDIHVAEAPTCTPPTNVFTTNTTANSTTLGWVAGSGSSTSWEIEYGPIGFSLGSGTMLTVTTNPYTVTGLSGSTTYAFYVREVCSPTDKSPWEGPQLTSTTCSSPLTPPYTENFDGPDWVPFANTANPGSLGNCWLKTPSANFNYQWYVNPNSIFSSNTGPNADHTSGNGKYLATQSFGFGTGTQAVLRSPQIDLTTVSNPELTFWYHMYGSGIDELEVEVKAGTNPWVTLQTISGQQQTSSNAAWQSATLSLAAYGTQTVFIRFVGKRTNTASTSVKLAIDDVSIVAGSTCPTPNGLAISNIAATSAQADWNTGGAGQFEVKYGLQNFDPNSAGTSIVTGTSPATLAPLTSNTDYDVYLRRICTNDTSSWIGPVSFKTACFATAPFVENFDGTDWTSGSQVFPQTIGTIDDCWDRTTSNTYFWSTGPEQFPSTQTGPQNDHTTGSGKFMFTNQFNFGGSGTINADLETPSIDLSPLDTPELSFWYHMYGAQIGSLIVQIDNGSGWTNLTTITGQQQTSKTAPWEEEIINLAAYKDDTVKLRFRGTKAASSFFTEIAIDDIDIHELPSCPKPDDLNLSNITFNSVEVDWTTGGASNWMIKYGPPGFTPAQATYLAASTNPFTITGLASNTVFEVWVRDSCGTGDVSDWIGPETFRTACSPIIAPYSEDFDGNTFVTWSFANQAGAIDDCYRRTTDDEYFWVPGPPLFPSFQTGPDSDHTSGSGQYMYARTNSFPGNLQAVTSLVTPWIDVSQLATPELSFWYHMYGINIDKLEVRVRRYDGTQQLVVTLNGQSQFSSSANWGQSVTNLSAFAGDTIRVSFSAFTNGMGFRAEIAIDDLEINNPQNCNAPTNLATSNPTGNSVDLSWNSSASAAGSTIEYGPSGFTPGSGTFITNVTSPYTVTGLLGATGYDFYVRDSCSWGGLSTWVGPVTDSTLSCPPVTAAFNFSVTGLTVNFDGTPSTGGPIGFGWDFGDGNIDTGATVSHTYLAGGTYSVSLIVVNACGQLDTLTQTIAICEPILGAFTFVKNGLTVDFDANASSGTGLQFDWLYGDGNTGVGANSSHTYATDGTYLVNLILTDTCGSIDTVQQFITVCDSLAPTINIVQNGLTVDFSVNGANAATNNWSWNFGDANTGNGVSPTHTYGSAGTYIVSVTVVNVCGEIATADTILTLCNEPTANWTFNIISSNASGMTVQFDGSASIGASSFLWEFGDGNTNTTSAIPVHTYVPAGLFWVVKLTVFNDCGDSDSFESSLAAIGIDDLKAAGVKIFPNPVDDRLIITLPGFVEVEQLTLTALDGQQINVPQQRQMDAMVLNTAQLAQGQYVLSLYTNAGEVSFTLVVRH